jgi:thiol-disulfide isomerase/thioredoxin
MRVLHINSEKDVKKIYTLDNLIKNNSDVFILVYMDGCGPCNATRPEWEKLEHVLKEQYEKKNNLVIVDFNKNFLPKLNSIGSIDGFPAMKYINNNGKDIETYENSSIGKKDRSLNSFINWIESKINTVVSTTSPYDVYNRIESKDKKSKKKYSSNNKTRRSKIRKNKSKRGGKWSRKYKASINCSKPKGFSQKQYCKYGRK